MQKILPENRSLTGLPKIGIRPCIDGRRGGVRESLEEQTMNMAKAAAKLYTQRLRHACGLPVECVIADTTIGGVAESAACEEKFRREGVGVSLTVTPCWCYGTETMDMDPHRPKAVWGFNGTERPGAVYLAAVLAAHNQKGLPAFAIYGRDVQDADDTTLPTDVEEKLLRFGRAAIAMASMRGNSYLSMGSVAMGIAGSMVNAGFFEKWLGMRVESVDLSEFVRRWEEGIYDEEEYYDALHWAKEHMRIGRDPNPPELRQSDLQKEEVLKTCVLMALIARDLMVGNPKLAEMGFGEEAMGHNAIAAGFQGQRQWTDHFPNGDFLEIFLNSSFDWNGIREPYVVATENDALNGATMLMGKLLTGKAQVFADVRTYWSKEALERVTGWKPDGDAANGFMHLINSGAAALDGAGYATANGKPTIKEWWCVSPEDAKANLAATEFCAGSRGYFRGGGLSSRFLTKGGMPITLARLNWVHGLGPVMHIAEGVTVDLPENVYKTIDERTDPTWPSTFFAPRLTGTGAFKDVYSVMANWGANHGAFCGGHIGADLIALCAMLRIPVCMHNVPDEQVYRPTMFAGFGTEDAEAADYRACQTLGPVYGAPEL
jgi:L-fucose isomerase